MSVLDKFLNVIKLNDDYEEEEFYDEEAPLEEEDPVPVRRVIKKRDDDDLFAANENRSRGSALAEEEPEEESAPVKPQRALTTSRRSSESSKISPIRSRKRGDSSGMKVCVIRPHSMEDAREITESLLTECTVILNVEGLELELAQRIIDFSSGSCFAIDGNLQKISNYIFVITPSTVDLTGDFQEILSGAFDVPLDR